MHAIRPGLCSVTFRGLSPEQIIGLAAEAGIEGIEWGADVHVPVGDQDQATAVARQSAAAGVECASYGTYLGARAPIDDRADVAAACETAAALGTTNLRVWSQLGVDPNATDTERAAITAGIRLAGEVAAEHGMTIGIEFHAKTLTETAESALRLMADVDAPNVFAYWQPNFWTDNPHDVAGQVAEMHAMRPHLSHLHTFWWLARGKRQPLSDGVEMWPQVFAATEATDRAWREPRYAFMEFVADDDPDQFRRDAATLLTWLRRSPGS